MIEACDDFCKRLVGDLIEVAALGIILADEAVGVLVGAALPGGVGVGEVDREAGGGLDPLETGELLAVVEGERVTQAPGDAPESADGLAAMVSALLSGSLAAMR